MQRYSAAGRASVTTSTFQYGALWNASTTKRIYLMEFWIDVGTGPVAQARLCRYTAFGTPGGTVTPDVDNDYDRAVAPPSGALVYVPAWSVTGTTDASVLGKFNVVSDGGMVDLRFGETRNGRGHRGGHRGGIAIDAGRGIAVDIIAGLADTRCVWIWEE